MNSDIKAKINSFRNKAKDQISVHQSSLDKAPMGNQTYRNALSNRIEMYKIGQDLVEILLEVIEEIESDKRKSIYEATSDGGFKVVNIDREDPDEMDEEAIFNRFRSR